MTHRTNTRTRLAAGAAILATTIFAASAGAGPKKMKLIDASAWGDFFNGGPFEVEPVDFGFTPGGSGEFGASSGNFLTFAVEKNDQPWEGDHFEYKVELSTDALDNGSGGGNDVIGDGSVDDLDARTAFLYTAFVNGTLADKLYSFDNSTFTYGELASGKALQMAILTIEDEIDYVNGLGSSLIALADEAVALNGDWYNKGHGSVRVLNVSDASGHAYMDFLVLVPLPAPAVLGLVGLVGVGAAARRRRRSGDRHFSR